VSTTVIIPVTGLQAQCSVGAVLVSAGATVLVTGVQATGQIAGVLVWGLVDNGQNPNWNDINNTQSPNWTEILEAA
jgi:hypothetical protein